MIHDFQILVFISLNHLFSWCFYELVFERLVKILCLSFVTLVLSFYFLFRLTCNNLVSLFIILSNRYDSILLVLIINDLYFYDIVDWTTVILTFELWWTSVISCTQKRCRQSINFFIVWYLRARFQISVLTLLVLHFWRSQGRLMLESMLQLELSTLTLDWQLLVNFGILLSKFLILRHVALQGACALSRQLVGNGQIAILLHSSDLVHQLSLLELRASRCPRRIDTEMTYSWGNFSFYYIVTCLLNKLLIQWWERILREGTSSQDLLFLANFVSDYKVGARFGHLVESWDSCLLCLIHIFAI